MAVQGQRYYAQKIKSVASLARVFRAQELIASSRISAARTAQSAAVPYADAITVAVSAVAAHNPGIDHPLIRPKLGNDRVAVLVISADRGMAGSYNGGVIREAEGLLRKLSSGPHPKQVDLYVAGRRAINYYHYRQAKQTAGPLAGVADNSTAASSEAQDGLAGEWIYGSDHPTDSDAIRISNTLLEAFSKPTEQGGVGEVYVVYTKFKNLVTQEPSVVRMLPLAIVGEADGNGRTQELTADGAPSGKTKWAAEYPLYEFEPSETQVLDALLPRYVTARIRSFMEEAAASEVAARQRAMHTAVDNTHTMIEKYTRLANAARQNDITEELNEIVAGASALSADPAK
jgi:F-type H+-transporting ATPase subunit gamma